jgi:hypothetical protein
MDVIVMNQVSARELNTVHRERERKHKEIYVVVLERIYSRVKRCASVGMRTCWFEMPEVVFGYPMFDVERCIRFAMRHLAMNGFRVARIANSEHDKVIDISWAPAEQHSVYGGGAPVGVGAPLTAAGVPSGPGEASMADGAAMAFAGGVSAVHLLSHPILTRNSHDNAAAAIVSIKRRKPGGPGGTRAAAARSNPQNHRPAGSFVSHNIIPSYVYGR